MPEKKESSAEANKILMESFNKLPAFLQGRVIAYSEELLLKHIKRSVQKNEAHRGA